MGEGLQGTMDKQGDGVAADVVQEQCHIITEGQEFLVVVVMEYLILKMQLSLPS